MPFASSPRPVESHVVTADDIERPFYQSTLTWFEYLSKKQEKAAYEAVSEIASLSYREVVDSRLRGNDGKYFRVSQ